MERRVSLTHQELCELLEEAWLDGKGASLAPLSTTRVKAAKAAARAIEKHKLFPSPAQLEEDRG